VDLLSVIRRWHGRDKLSIREIARRTGLSRHTIRKYLASDYVRMDDAGNSGSLSTELEHALQRHACDRIAVTEAGEWRVQKMIERWGQTLQVPIDIREDNCFLCSLTEFREWAADRKTLRMEYFYRSMRRKTGWLMDGNQPQGESNQPGNFVSQPMERKSPAGNCGDKKECLGAQR
jgi:deoxyribodipyrimidine photolyase-like uncharacterized protein